MRHAAGAHRPGVTKARARLPRPRKSSAAFTKHPGNAPAPRCIQVIESRETAAALHALCTAHARRRTLKAARKTVLEPAKGVRTIGDLEPGI